MNKNKEKHTTNNIKEIVDNYVEKSKDAKEEMKQAKHIAKEEMKDALSKSWQDFGNEMKEEILNNENKIKKLKEKIIDEGKSEISSAITQLEQKNTDLKNKLKEFKDESKEKIEAFKKEFTHDINGLSNALKDLFKKNIE